MQKCANAAADANAALPKSAPYHGRTGMTNQDAALMGMREMQRQGMWNSGGSLPRYGAFAYSRSTGRWGWSYQAPDQASAEAAPLIERKCVSMGAWIVAIPTFVPVLNATRLLSDDHAGAGAFATLPAMRVSRAVLALTT